MVTNQLKKLVRDVMANANQIDESTTRSWLQLPHIESSTSCAHSEFIGEMVHNEHNIN